MINKTIQESVKKYIQSKFDDPVYLPNATANRTYPCFILEDLTTSEHDVLNGVFEASVNVVYMANANEQEEDGELELTESTNAKLIYEHLTCETMINSLNAISGIKVFDIYLNEATSEDRDGRMANVFTLEMVACEV